MHAAIDVSLPSGLAGSLYVRGRGVPVVFVHGQLGDRHGFDRVVDIDVVRDRPSATIDLPWHGASKSPLGGGVEKLSMALHEFLDALGWTRVVAVGHSLGALATFDAAIARPERFAHVVLVGMPGDLDDGKRDQMRAFASLFRKPVGEKVASIVTGMWYSTEHQQRTPALVAQQLGRLQRNDRECAAFVCNAIAAMPDRLPHASSSKSKLHATFVSARDDLIAPPEEVVPFVRALNAKHVVLDGGHFPFEEQPDEFDRVLREVLANSFL